MGEVGKLVSWANWRDGKIDELRSECSSAYVESVRECVKNIRGLRKWEA